MTAETKKSKLRFIWALPIGLLTVSGLSKIVGQETLVQRMQDAGMGHMTFGVGIITLLCVITFLIPKTRNIGFLLCVAFAGGILASEWANHRPVVAGIVIQSSLWIGMYFENPSFFRLNSTRSASSA